MEKNDHVSRCAVVSPIKNGHFSAIAMLVFGDGTYPETPPCHNDPLGAVSWDFYLSATHKDQTCHRCAWCCPHTTHAPRSEGMDVVLNSETRAQELRFVKHLSSGSFGLVSLVEHKQTKKCFAKPSAMIWDIYGLKRSLQVMEVGIGEQAGGKNGLHHQLTIQKGVFLLRLDHLQQNSLQVTEVGISANLRAKFDIDVLSSFLSVHLPRSVPVSQHYAFVDV